MKNIISQINFYTMLVDQYGAISDCEELDRLYDLWLEAARPLLPENQQAVHYEELENKLLGYK